MEFGTITLVQGDVERGYPLLVGDLRAKVPIETFREVIVKMHPAARPASLSAGEFEPAPSQGGMSIFLYGSQGDERFYYRLLMIGSATAGYGVGGVWRGSGPYPPSRLRQPLSGQIGASTSREVVR